MTKIFVLSLYRYLITKLLFYGTSISLVNKLLFVTSKLINPLVMSCNKSYGFQIIIFTIMKS